MWIGTVAGLQRGMADGKLVLGGTLLAPDSGAALRVGSISDASLEGAGVGSGSGSLLVEGIENFSFVAIGSAALHKGTANDTAHGTATIGSGGIVNNTSTSGDLRIGVAGAIVASSTVTGSGASATGSAAVMGDISGYDNVSVGRVQYAGRADGQLELSSGKLAARNLEVGVVRFPNPGVTVTEGVAEATGRLSVTDGHIAIDPPGSISVGATPASGVGIDTARGTLELTRSTLEGGRLSIGSGAAAQGSFTADQSTIEVQRLVAGTNAGTASVALQDSRLHVQYDDSEFSGTMFIGAGIGSTGVFTATDSSIRIDRSLAIGSGSGPDPNQASLAMVGSNLSVGTFIQIGSSVPGSQGELSLTDATATVGGHLFLGASANSGALYGEATLQIDASLLTIEGELRMNAGAAPGLKMLLGVGGTDRGIGGYGAIDTDHAALAGQLWVDFAGLDPYAVGSSFDFDLLFAARGFDGNFDQVGFANLGSGYHVQSYGVVDVDNGEVWRLTLAATQVPLPGTIWLLLAGLLVAVTSRRR